ncbi:ATP-dependent RNA helicase SUV3L- mitochondrial [Striga hermonthica]|uniref:ATP-dependent RNA helicase SUV3L- mitochondrial n=1 Tax=Striga hermonthica TaxID=68872 RepID=A0A9N7NTN6_STRHE|nr:ATP-dependent RNA helicase SUV3L- mitochondrial [Striga hermonthica]
MKRSSDDLVKYLVSLGPGDKSDRFLFPIFVEFCLEEFPDKIRRFRKMVDSADMTQPHTWFPFARAMKRKIIYHCGPTNSGKTLLTGQEKKDFPFSNHVACTVEMVSTDELYDVAVIDEIQMMADSCRGYAWTRALLRLKADEIHLCGDPSVLNVVRRICSETGDELVEQHYERFKPLVVEAKTLLGDLNNVNREIVLLLSRGGKYLRIVFYSLSKYNGDKMVCVPASQVKQIAGRADVKKVGLFPFYEQVELFAGQLPDMKFSKLLENFSENCRLDGSYFLCQHMHIRKIANMLDKIQGLSLEDRFNFCLAPVNIRDPKAMYHLLRFASSYAQKLPVNIAMGMPKCAARNDSELLDLETRHQVLAMYLWLSNHFEEERFPFVHKAETMGTDIAGLLAESLLRANWKPESRGGLKPKTEKKEENGYHRPMAQIKLLEKCAV